jgi:hypothetical protein
MLRVATLTTEIEIRWIYKWRCRCLFTKVAGFVCVTESVKHRLHALKRNVFMLNTDLLQYIRIICCLRSCHRNVSFPLLKACPRWGLKCREDESLPYSSYVDVGVCVFFFYRKFTLNCYSKSKARGRMLLSIFFRHVERKFTVLFVIIKMNVC